MSNEDIPLLDQFPEAQLTMRDRLPYHFLLSQMILTFQKAILNIQYSAEELREAVEGFVNHIPTLWRDPEFTQDLQKAQQLIYEDLRPMFCGVPADREYCEEMGIPTERLVRTFDYFKVFNAVVNLLNRRHMLLKPQYKEIMTGIKAIPEMEPYLEEEDYEG
ncbi:hypothetical protein MUP59_07955 [Candidatus Bathyarchaeota archaeon]|nr:hypothetical protein [Candidatus Bathyarchaeota archaeon]